MHLGQKQQWSLVEQPRHTHQGLRRLTLSTAIVLQSTKPWTKSSDNILEGGLSSMNKTQDIFPRIIEQFLAKKKDRTTQQRKREEKKTNEQNQRKQKDKRG